MSDIVLQCPFGGPCNGGSDPTVQCDPGYSGVYCSVCVSGYIKSGNGECVLCTDASTSFTLSILPTFFLGILALILFLRKRIKALVDRFMKKYFDKFKNYAIKGMGTKLKILVGFYQITSQLQPVLGVLFPAIYQQFINVFSFINFDFGAIFAEVTFNT